MKIDCNNFTSVSIDSAKQSLKTVFGDLESVLRNASFIYICMLYTIKYCDTRYFVFNNDRIEVKMKYITKYIFLILIAQWQLLTVFAKLRISLDQFEILTKELVKLF